MDNRPLAIDLFCGLGGWTEGLLAEGYRVVGFDNERHWYGAERYPAKLVLQDVLTVHGAQFKDATLIVASPPCQAYSYRAMPWKRAKALPPPDNSLFEACFRIQREAIEAAGRFIPLVVENVCGAQKWVGRARWHYGSFYLWGDVPALMPIVKKAAKNPVFRVDGSGRSFQTESTDRHTKNDCCSLLGVAHNTTSGKGRNPDGRNANNPARGEAIGEEVKVGDAGWRDRGTGRQLQDRAIKRISETHHYKSPEKDYGSVTEEGIKQGGLSGRKWFDQGASRHGSKSISRKVASAMIAKIPLALSRHIAVAWKP